jgi:hypothetical protein
MNRILIMFLLLAAVVTWTLQAMNRDKLTKRLDQARLGTRFMGRVNAEHEDLRRRQPFVGEVEGLRRDRAEMVNLRRELAHREQAAAGSKAGLMAVGREILPPGIWLPISAMKDLGRRTPHAALQTAIWAAGDAQVAALKELLTFEPAARKEAEQIMARLPAGLRPSSPEILAAQALIRHAPKGELQIMAEVLKGFDIATEFLALRKPGGETQAFYLRLRWEPGGWRVIVPPQVMERAARTVAGETGPPAVDPWRDWPRLPEP